MNDFFRKPTEGDLKTESSTVESSTNSFFRKSNEDDLKANTSSIQEDVNTSSKTDINNIKTEEIDIFKPAHEIKDMSVYDQKMAYYVLGIPTGEKVEGVPSVSRLMELDSLNELLGSGANIIRATYQGSDLVAVEYQELTNDKKRTL